MSRRGAVALVSGLALFGISAPVRADAVGCVVNAQCKNPTPVCGLAQTCTGCTWGADCAGRPATPACLEQSGACVECTDVDPTACRGTTPYCDAERNKCVGCRADGDCAAGKTCVNQQCVRDSADAGPIAQPEAGVVEAGARDANGVLVEGGGCSMSRRPAAWPWPILGGLALALLTRRKNRR